MNGFSDRIQFHHLGLAVKHPEKAAAFLSNLGYIRGEAVYDPAQGVHLIWCSHPAMPAVEIIYQTAARGPLDSVLSKREELIYHVCYAVDDIAGAVEALMSAGTRMTNVSEEKPSALFAGQSVSFYYTAAIGLIEFLAPTRK